MALRRVFLFALAACVPMFPALAGTRYTICIHETGCPFPGSPGERGVWVPCGTNIMAKAQDMCTIIENGQKKPGRYTNPIVINGPIDGGRCGAAKWEFTCLDE